MSRKDQSVDALMSSVDSTTLQQRFQGVMARRVLLVRQAFSLLQPSAARDAIVKAIGEVALMTASLPAPPEGPLSRLSAPLLRLMMQFLPIEEHLLCRAVLRTIRSAACHQQSWPERMVLKQPCSFLAKLQFPPAGSQQRVTWNEASLRRSTAVQALALEGMRGRVTSIHATHLSWQQFVEALAPSLASLRCMHVLQLQEKCPVSAGFLMCSC
jgi:hypothetical protein